MHKALSCGKRKMTIRDKSPVCGSDVWDVFRFVNVWISCIIISIFSNSYILSLFFYSQKFSFLSETFLLPLNIFSLNFATYFASFGDFVMSGI